MYRSLTKVFIVVLLVASTIDSKAQINPLFPINTPLNDSSEIVFDEIKSLILEKYYSLDLTENDLYYAAIQGMLRHISPPETPTLARLWTAEEYERILNSLKGISNVSIGISSSYNANDGSLTVTSIHPKGPAVGILEKHDRILAIDGQTLQGQTTKSVNNLLAGEEGSKVSLTINRGIKIIKKTVERRSYPVENLIVNKSGNVAHITIKKIYQGLADELREEIESLDSTTTALVLDLRHNTGGVLGEGVKVTNLFLGEKSIVLRTVSRSDKAQSVVSKTKSPFEHDMIVLIDGKTASAAEIIASAMQDHKRATIVGSKSYGKGVIETTHKLSNDYRVKFITSAMYTPLGKPWQNRGILPDFLVEQTEAQYQSSVKQEVNQRFRSDIYLVTASKLLNNSK